MENNENFFRQLSRIWGPFTIDRFANQKNAKTPRYNALFWNPQCEAVDAFIQDWSNETNWVVPPVYLVTKALRHAKACRAAGVVIAPLWESAPFWPLIRKTNGTLRKFIIDYKVFTDTRNILELGDFKESLLGSTRFKTPIIAMQFNFDYARNSQADRVVELL